MNVHVLPVTVALRHAPPASWYSTVSDAPSGSSGLLHERIGGASVSLHPEAAARLGLRAGQRVTVSFNGTSGEAVLNLDDSIDEGVALVPRSMGIAIREPVAVKVKA